MEKKLIKPIDGEKLMKAIEELHTCPICKKRLMSNELAFGAIQGRLFDKKRGRFKCRYFCTNKCKEDYEKDFIVEIYNGKPIYCVEVATEKRYMPYLEAAYYFTDTNDCKKRMDAKNISFFPFTL